MNSIDIAANVILILVAVPALGSCGYLLLHTLLSAPLRPLPASSRKIRFDVIVPSHNEEAGIEHIIRSLKKVDWPADRFRVVVVADNCTDGTAAKAASEGAEVLVRNDPSLRGKGYALAFGFKASRDLGWADAVVVVDADAVVSPNLLEAYARRLEQGADAVQAHYGISNPDASWRTRLLTIAKAAFHIERSRARERLRVSCGIRGNGWCVTHRLLARVPYRSFSLTEDLEYGITLGLAGYRVHYADEAHADAEMVVEEKPARAQRQRWEAGRFALIRSRTLPLLAAALRQRSRVCLDLALDLMVLPLSYVTLNVVALLVLAGAATAWEPVFMPWLWAGIACVAALLLHILRGWQLSHTGVQGLLDLLRAPFMIVWKLGVMLRRRESKGWERTVRVSESSRVN